MFKFNAKSYLSEKGIVFKEKGKNIMKEHIGIRCIKCDDRSNHLNIKLDGTHALCFRCGVHVFGAKKVLELLEGRKLKQMEYLTIVNKHKSDVDFAKSEDRKEKEEDKIAEWRERIMKVREFVELGCWPLRANSPYNKYLESRGIRFDFAQWFGIREGRGGDWGYYAVIPIRDDRGELVSYVGRLVCESKTGIRYKKASGDVSEYKGLFGIAECKKLNLLDKGYLILVEGVFDVLKLLQNNVPAVGLMTKNINDFQLRQLLYNVSFDTVILIGLDADVEVRECYALRDRLSTWYKRAYVLGYGGRDGDIVFSSSKKDFGDMDNKEIKEFEKFLLRTLYFELTKTPHNYVPGKIYISAFDKIKRLINDIYSNKF
jgi:hypothetical protein